MAPPIYYYGYGMFDPFWGTMWGPYGWYGPFGPWNGLGTAYDPNQSSARLQVKPQDVAFLHPGQKAMVKFSAYDYTIYGGLKANLELISADTISDEDGNSFYLIQVRTDKNHLGSDAQPLLIIPGMIATVDIITGEKSVLDYLLKPVLKARAEALRER